MVSERVVSPVERFAGARRQRFDERQRAAQLAHTNESGRRISLTIPRRFLAVGRRTVTKPSGFFHDHVTQI